MSLHSFAVDDPGMVMMVTDWSMLIPTTVTVQILFVARGVFCVYAYPVYPTGPVIP